MADKKKIGVIICDRCRTCVGGECLEMIKPTMADGEIRLAYN